MGPETANLGPESENRWDQKRQSWAPIVFYPKKSTKLKRDDYEKSKKNIHSNPILILIKKRRNRKSLIFEIFTFECKIREKVFFDDFS